MPNLEGLWKDEPAGRFALAFLLKCCSTTVREYTVQHLSGARDSLKLSACDAGRGKQPGQRLMVLTNVELTTEFLQNEPPLTAFCCKWLKQDVLQDNLLRFFSEQEAILIDLRTVNSFLLVAIKKYLKRVHKATGPAHVELGWIIYHGLLWCDVSACSHASVHLQQLVQLLPLDAAEGQSLLGGTQKKPFGISCSAPPVL